LDAAGPAKPLASATTLIGDASTTAGIDAVAASTSGARVMVQTAGRVFVIARATGTARELPLGPHRAPQLSPSGEHCAFIRDGDLWVAPVLDPDSPVASPERTQPVRRSEEHTSEL